MQYVKKCYDPGVKNKKDADYCCTYNNLKKPNSLDNFSHLFQCFLLVKNGKQSKKKRTLAKNNINNQTKTEKVYLIIPELSKQLRKLCSKKLG